MPKSILERFADFIFPPRCAACRTLIGNQGDRLCDLCGDSFRAAKEHVCSLCLKPLVLCDCPNRYMERNNLHTLVKLYRYQPRDRELPENRLIYRLKATSDITVIKFLADELVPVISRHINSEEEYVLVGVPRSHRAIRKNGGDHIALLCKELSKRLHIPYVKAIKRVRGGSAQKKKGRAERISAASKTYYKNSKISLKGKRPILVDDVVTSGASLTACAKVLRSLGARKIICAVVGSSFRYQDLIENSHYYAERRRKYGI